MEIKRASTGVKGLDERIGGGLPTPSVILVAGEPGTGKTTFCMQCLFRGAKLGELGIYVTAISEPVDQIHKYMASYRFYDRRLVDEGLVKFLDISEVLMKRGARKALDMTINFIRRSDARRVVIDSITPFSYTFTEPQEYRRFLHEFFTVLKAMETLTLLVAEFSPEATTAPESYMADGVIYLYLQQGETPSTFKPGLQVRKLKGTEHPKDILRLGFTREGIRVLE
jgi:circadian clock protein KaiC